VLWFDVAGYNKICLNRYVKCLVFLPNFKQVRGFWTDFLNVPNIKFHRNPSSGSSAHTCGQMAGQT
jgi:hypothetical protein